MDGMIGGVGGAGGVGMIGGAGGLGMMGGGASPPAMGDATGASGAAQSGGAAAASSPADVTVNISGASKAALAADVQAGNGVSITINAPNGISSTEWQNLLSQNEWDSLVADLLLALLLQQMQKK